VDFETESTGFDTVENLFWKSVWPVVMRQHVIMCVAEGDA
jgi:hypothetical protein